MVRNISKGYVRKREKVRMDDQKMNYISSKSRNTGNEYRPLLTYDQLPDYMKDNEYILDYYRANWSIKQAFFSLFRWHNETLNVWTHLLGFMLFLGLTVSNLLNVTHVADLITVIIEQFPSNAQANISNNSFIQGLIKFQDLKQEPNNLKLNTSLFETVAENWSFYVFLCGSMFCLLSSSICHLFSCHSNCLNVYLLHVDYIGITVMIITSFFPPIYYIFQCSPRWQIIYLACITIMGACTVIALLSPVLSYGKYRSLRAMLFVSMGLFGLIPAIHALILNWRDPHCNVTLAYELGMALSYLIGTGFYIFRIPERWWPGWFDLAGHSHQIFHVFVVMGALAHYGAAQIFLRYRSTIGCDIVHTID